MPDFFTYTLSEAAYLWMGLHLQEYVRFSRLAAALPWIVMLWSTVLLYRAIVSGTGWPGFARVIGYWVVMLLFTCFFWPEATQFGWGIAALDPRQVRSFIASADPANALQSAADVPLVPSHMRTPLTLAPAFRLGLPTFLEWPLKFGQYASSTVDRPFASTMPLQWLLGTTLTGDATSALHDWVQGCYLPALLHTQQGHGLRTAADTLPWGGGAVSQGLVSRKILPGASGTPFPRWLFAFVSPNTEITCADYLQRVLEETQRWLLELRSPAGRPLLEVFRDELGMTPDEQAQFLVRREIQKQSEHAIASPAMAGAYAGLRALSLTSRLLGGIMEFSPGTVVNAVSNEFSRTIDQLTIIVRLAVALIWWLPDFMGMIQLVLLGFFPVYFVLRGTVPGQQFSTLASYLGYLAYACSLPLWFALIHLVSQLAVLGASSAIPGAAMLRQHVIIIIGLLTIQGVFGWMLWRSSAGLYNAIRGGTHA